jgi:hypothetical protein
MPNLLGAVWNYTEHSSQLSFFPGFYGMGSPITATIKSSKDVFGWNNMQFVVTATRREFPAWLGGTFSPQAFWDDTNGQLVFLASAAEDANFNHKPSLRTYNGALVTGATAYALTTDGVNAYYCNVIPTATGSQQEFYKAPLNNIAVPSASQALTIDTVVTRLFYEATTNRLMWFEKSFQVNQYCTYTGNIFAILATLANANFVDLISLAPLVGESPSTGIGGGATFQEGVRQTDAPDIWIVAVNKIAGEAFYTIKPALAGPFGTPGSDVGVLISAPYTDPGTGEKATGVCSNLIFVPSSGSTGNTPLWADRIYFGAQGVGVPIQLGVPGNWTVIGSFLNSEAVLAGITAFDTFDAQYQSNGGTVAFSLANGSATGSPPMPPVFLPANFTPVTPNQKINLANAAPQPWVQWLAVLTWNYSLAQAPTISPVVDFVDIGYFVGASTVPPVVGIHYKGRSRWSVALAGQSAPSMEIVYQKTNVWTTTRGRAIIGYAIFQGNLVCFEGYTLLQMETGPTWNGALIRSKAVTGYIMNEPCDKYIRKIQVNVMEWQNQDFPTVPAWLEIQPLRAGVEPAGSAWFLPIPVTQVDPQPEQVQGIMASFLQVWCRALAIQISTSNDTGVYAPATEQAEDIQAILLTIRKSPPRYAMPVK